MPESIVNLVAALAWPVVVLTIFVCSKGDIAGLILRINKLKVHDVEVELKEKIVSLASGTDLLGREEDLSNSSAATAGSSMKSVELALVGGQPTVAIMNKWAELESALYRKVTAESRGEWKGVLAAVEYLFINKMMTAEEVKLFNRLYEIRNIVAYEVSDAPISIGYAFEFVRTASLLMSRLGGKTSRA
jgi:hypothetical protein